MTNASTGIALVATHLAHADRRALSQAWYSALYVAAPQSRAAHPGGFTGPAPRVVRATLPPRTAGEPGASPPFRAQSRSAPRAAGTSDAGERRRPACEVTRRVERAVARLATIPKRRANAQTIDIAGGRIRLLVRDDGRATRVIALCAAPLRERVERALAHARFTLAISGASVAR